MLTNTCYDIFCTISNRKLSTWLRNTDFIYTKWVMLMTSFKKKNFLPRSWNLHVRGKISSPYNLFHLFKWNEIDVVWKIKIATHDALLAWNTCHIDTVGRSCTHILHVYHLADPQQSRTINGCISIYDLYVIVIQ